MSLGTESQSLRRPRSPFAVPQPIDHQLARLADGIIDYARKANVLHFRYCRRPDSPSSHHTSLQEAVDSLIVELRIASKRPHCQSLAIALLKELASLSHQPPCRNESEQKRVAQIINTALLEIR